ncbi:glutamine amidotransferase [bacterium]|nr:glutamine amidotransferase [bacterium]
MKSIYILKMGNSPPELIIDHGDFEDQFLTALNLPPDAARLINVQYGAQLPDPDEAAGIIITGSLSNITENTDWMQRAAAWVRQAVKSETPMMGVCFGHQLMGWAHGAEVDNNPNGPEYGTVEIELVQEGYDDALLAGLSSPFHAQASHSQSILSLPDGAVRLAYNDHEEFHALRYGKNAWSFQFHPEWNDHIMKDVIAVNRETLAQAGQDADFLLSMVENTDPAGAIMEHFAALVAQNLDL